MQVENVASSHLKRVAYDRQERVLYIQFHSGPTYAWQDIPRGVYQQLLAAPSKGRFLHEVLRPEYGDGERT